MNRRWLKLRFSCRCLHELGCLRKVEVDQLSTDVADRVIVPLSFSVVTAGAIAKLNLVNQPCFFQEAKGVVDCGVANRRQLQTRRLENFIRRRMIFPGTNNLKHCFPLPR